MSSALWEEKLKLEVTVFFQVFRHGITEARFDRLGYRMDDQLHISWPVHALESAAQ